MIDIPEDLAETYQQVVEKETNVYSKIYDEISYMEDLKLRYQHAVNSGISNQSEEPEEMLSKEEQTQKLNEKFENIQEVLIKQACLTNFTRDILYKYEIQKSIVKDVSKIDINQPLEKNNTIFEMLKNGSDALDYAENISTVTDERFQIQREVFTLNKKYINLLQSIENKWSILKGRKVIVEAGDVELKKLQEKVELRETKLKVLVELLKNMISSNTSPWKENSREVQTLICCDAFCSENAEEIVESVKLLKESREAEITKSRQGKISSYFQRTTDEE